MKYKEAWKLLITSNQSIRRSKWPTGQHVARKEISGYAMYDGNNNIIWLNIQKHEVVGTFFLQV